MGRMQGVPISKGTAPTRTRFRDRLAHCYAQSVVNTAVDTTPRSPFLTGGRFGTSGSSRTLVPAEYLPLVAEKQIVLVRHGLTTWNVDKRIQGASDEPCLTTFGEEQARRTAEGLRNYPFKACFSSPISRARQCADIIWQGRQPEIRYLDDLKEAYLGWLQGMKNSYAAENYPEVYEAWRARPDEFEIEGGKPIHRVFAQADRVWRDVLLDPSDVSLVISHKSVLRALVCTALGLGPCGFRAVDVHNAAVSVFWINQNGEAMLQNLNMTSHLRSGDPY